jgi:hypothetical protein
VPHEHGGGEQHGARVEDHPDPLAERLLAQRQPVEGVNDDQYGGAVEDLHDPADVRPADVRRRQHVDGLGRGGDHHQRRDDGQVPPEAPGVPQ